MTYRALGYWGVDFTSHDYPDIGLLTDDQGYVRFVQDSYDPEEVYVFRFNVSGLPSQIKTAAQVYPLVEAYVASMPIGNRNQDVRAIALSPSGGDRYRAELIFHDGGGVHLNSDRVGTVLEKMNKYLVSRSSPLRVIEGAFATVAGDKQKTAKPFWFSKPLLWSYSAFEGSGQSDLAAGFTEAFFKGRRGVYLNSSAIAPQYELPAYESPPIGPSGTPSIPGISPPQGTPGQLPGTASGEIGSSIFSAAIPVILIGGLAFYAVNKLKEGK